MNTTSNTGAWSIKIDKAGVAATEVVASLLSEDRATTLGQNIRRTLRTGERLYIESPAGFRVLDAR